MPKITISQTVAKFSNINKIAVALARFEASNREVYPPIFGHYGGFERNTQAEESGIKKLHVALGKKDFLLKTWRFADGDKRTCDNFLVYVRHWVYSDYFHIIAIITPNAHANADKLIHGIIEQAEVFHANGLPDLQKIPYFDETYVL